jgi:hypothetical protein
MTAQPLQVEVNHGKAKHSAGCRDWKKTLKGTRNIWKMMTFFVQRSMFYRTTLTDEMRDRSNENARKEWESTGSEWKPENEQMKLICLENLLHGVKKKRMGSKEKSEK